MRQVYLSWNENENNQIELFYCLLVIAIKIDVWICLQNRIESKLRVSDEIPYEIINIVWGERESVLCWLVNDINKNNREKTHTHTIGALVVRWLMASI